MKNYLITGGAGFVGSHLAERLVDRGDSITILDDLNTGKMSNLEKIQEKFTKEFENLANKILEEKSNKFTEQNKLNITNILTPLKEKIEGLTFGSLTDKDRAELEEAKDPVATIGAVIVLALVFGVYYYFSIWF